MKKNILLVVLATLLASAAAAKALDMPQITFSHPVIFTPIMAVTPDGRVDLKFLEPCPIPKPPLPNVGNDWIIHVYYSEQANQNIYCKN